MHSTALYSAESPRIKTHTYLPSYTHNIFHLPPTRALPPLLLLPTHPTLALTGSDLATSGRRLPGSKLRQPLYGGSPTVAQCLPCKLANCLKLREPPKTVQRGGVCANLLRSAACSSSITFHMREPAPLCPYKATSSPSPPTSYSPVTPPYSSHPSTPPEKVCHVPGQ